MAIELWLWLLMEMRTLFGQFCPTNSFLMSNMTIPRMMAPLGAFLIVRIGARFPATGGWRLVNMLVVANF